MKFKMGLLIAFALTAATLASAAGVQPGDDKMSAMGKRAAAAVAKINARAGAPLALARAQVADDDDGCVNKPECGGEDEGDEEAIPGGQAELSIAVDKSGQHVVIGFNDTRGFDKNPISVSGFLYSEDGGKTFVDGGQLPSPGNEAIGTTLFPQVFGDPEVKYLGNCVFVYSSILIKKAGAATDVQTMGVHRSTDCGKTWQGPFEVTSATTPNGIVISDVPQDAAEPGEQTERDRGRADRGDHAAARRLPGRRVRADLRQRGFWLPEDHGGATAPAEL